MQVPRGPSTSDRVGGRWTAPRSGTRAAPPSASRLSPPGTTDAANATRALAKYTKYIDPSVMARPCCDLRLTRDSHESESRAQLCLPLCAATRAHGPAKRSPHSPHTPPTRRQSDTRGRLHACATAAARDTATVPYSTWAVCVGCGGSALAPYLRFHFEREAEHSLRVRLDAQSSRIANRTSLMKYS